MEYGRFGDLELGVKFIAVEKIGVGRAELFTKTYSVYDRESALVANAINTGGEFCRFDDRDAVIAIVLGN